ncbi:MAG: Ig-like domain-containing protein, partial [Muribaculaceae bacterium]|nr:Ig-like domain-containing protein [Muribaculaceae bacterium]
AAGWPAGDIDESPTRYVEFGVTAPEGKLLTINTLALKVGGMDTDAMQCHVSWSVEDSFGNPVTFYSPKEMKSGEMNSASTDLMLNLTEGQTLLMRVYPWTTEAQQTGTICLSDITIEGYVSNLSTDVSLEWPLDKGVNNPATAESSSTAFSFTSYSVGKDLVVTGTGKPVSTTGTMYQPVNNNQSDYTDDASIEFSLRPKAGLTFQPKHISFYITRNGTDGGLVQTSLQVGDHTDILESDIKPVRNNTEPKQTFCEYDINGVVVYGDAMTFRIAIKSLGNTKTLTVHSVRIDGEISGRETEVQTYTITAVPSIPEAGTVTRTPNSAKIEDGQEVTLSATENFGFRFTGWSAAGEVLSTDNPYTFTASKDLDIVAEYEKLATYPLELTLEGGANDYMVAVEPEGELIDGVRYYVAGTEVRLTAESNRILTFTNWDDNSTDVTRNVVVDEPKSVKASYAAEDYILGWDFHYDEPASDRQADFKAESDNAGMMSLHNEAGQSTSWLSRGVTRGAENDRYAARIWKPRSDKYFFEASFSAAGYSNLKIASALSCTYNTYTRFLVQYSLDGKNYTTIGEMMPGNRSWTDAEFDLPAEADGAARVYVRWYPDFDAPLHGNETEYDGLAITDVYVLAAPDAADDTTAPVLISSIPANDSEGASVNGSVVLTFDEKVRAGETRATLNGKELEASASGKVVIFKYSGLDYATKYTFSMPEGAVVDRNGNKAAALDITFTTMTRIAPEARLYDAVVDIDGTGDYVSLQAAIDAAPAGRISPWLIFVHNGRYKEHIDIPANKPFIHIIGQDRDKTVIYDDRLCGGENAVHVSVGATLVVHANDCFFENITFENSYGHEMKNGPQALAVNTEGDRAVFNNVAMLSYQDTWITPSKSSNRVYVHNSFIEGAV